MGTDADGRCIYASDSFLKLIGLTMHQAANDGWGSVLHPDDIADTMAAWKETARTGNAWYREHRMMGVDGKYHSILAQGVPIRDETGRIQRWAGINLDISRLKNTERALLEADRRKDEFLATLAHELRNPLAPIRNAVRILDSDAADERQRKWGREVIARQVQRMSLLLDDLLDVSRITRGQLELKKDYVDLKSVIGIAVETARPLLDSKQHQLTVNLPAGNVKLEADPLRLSQVIGNLLTNAAKYTDPEARSRCTRASKTRELVISHPRQGHRPHAESLPGLFTMFSQVNSAIDRAEGGLGIGLALVKGLVHCMAGASRCAARDWAAAANSSSTCHTSARAAEAVAGGRYRRRECQRRTSRPRSRRRRQSRCGRVPRPGTAILGLRSVHRVRWHRGAGDAQQDGRAPPSSTSACPA